MLLVRKTVLVSVLAAGCLMSSIGIANTENNYQSKSKASIASINKSPNNYTKEEKSYWSSVQNIISENDSYIQRRSKAVNLCNKYIHSNSASIKGSCRTFFTAEIFNHKPYGKEADTLKLYSLYSSLAKMTTPNDAIYPPAFYLLGSAYQYGLGVKKNSQLAIAYYKKYLSSTPFTYKKYLSPTTGATYAALHPWVNNTLNNIGICYESLQDYLKAYQSYTRAAKNGYALSQYNVGLLLSKGEGVIQNYKEAYAWASVAVAHGLSSAKTQKAAVNLRNSMAYFILLSNGRQGENNLGAAKTLARDYFRKYVVNIAQKRG